ELHSRLPRKNRFVSWTIQQAPGKREPESAACCAGIKRSCRNLLMRFCPQCGAPLLAGARFCVECGCALSAAAMGAGEAGSVRGGANPARNTITTAFVFVFVAIAVLGLAAAAIINWGGQWIIGLTPEAAREQIAAAPSAANAPSAGAPAAAPNAAPPEQNVTANPAAGGRQNGGLPPGHPTIELPTEARTFIDKIEKDAHAKPGDVAAWNRFGAVSMRAAM